MILVGLLQHLLGPAADEARVDRHAAVIGRR
jgi:hypothetical protein